MRIHDISLAARGRWHTLSAAIIAGWILVGLGLLIAALTDRIWWGNIAKSLIFMPMAISFVGASVIWKFVYDYRAPGEPQIGILNAVVQGLGGTPQAWITLPFWNSFFLMVILIWIQTGFAMVILANQPMYMSGAIDNEASDKAARFVRFCDSFNLPLVFVVDTPGAMPGVAEEEGGIIKRGGRFFNAIVEADVPKVTIIVRKAYGGGYAVMGSKQLSADLNFAWPTARIAVIGAEGAAQLLVKRFPDPTAPEVQKIRADFIEGYNLNLATPWTAAERGYIDGVIEPHETRLLIRKSLRLLRDKQPVKKVLRKHGLTPL